VELGVDIRMYAGKHAGRYPERLSDLVGAVFGDRAVFDQLTVCPASRKPYAHYAGLTDSDPPSAPLAFDLPGNHPGGGYVLFADGHVSWCGEEFLARLLKGAQGCVATGVWNSGTEVEIAVDRRRADEVEGRMRLEEGP
jgi:prepilin-type processing-associated H-X9-DG protein